MDAVGKHTHSLLLASWLRRRGLDVVSLSFPDYSTNIGREIKAFLSGSREYPSELQHMLFAANRWEKEDALNSYLSQGKTLIINRYTESNIVYGVANGLDTGWLANLEKGLPKTDLVLVLDAPPATLRSRRPGRKKDSYETDRALQEKVRRLYRKMARTHGWKLVSATGSVQEVQTALMDAVRSAMSDERMI